MINRIITVTVILLLLAGIGIYVFIDRFPQSVSGQKFPIPENYYSGAGSTAVRIQKQSGSYVPYTPEVFASAAGSRRVLFFYASWCPTCRPADKSFSNNTDWIPQGTVVIRVNYNDPDTDQNESELAGTYGITYQHTFVQIDESGNEITKWNGGDIDGLVGNIK